MSYEIRDDVPVHEGEQAAQLETGDIIAVGCARSAIGAVVHYHATARVIEEAGAPVQDAAGKAIEREFRHQSRDIAQIPAIAQACIDALLGEPQTAVEWGPEFLADVSIRVAIQLAPLAA